MGEIFGGGTTSSSGSNAPWAAQQPYLEDLFKNAQTVYNQRQTSGPFQGSFYSPENGTQIGAQNQASGYAGGTGQWLANGTAGASAGLYGNAGNFAGNAGRLAYGGAPGQGGLSTALNGAAINGANTLGAVANNGTGNPTSTILQNAGLYQNSAPVQQSIAATNAGIDQTLNENTLPGLNRAAAAGGSLNSSRAGAANAQAQEGAALAKGSADAGIYSNAFNTGLGTAASEYNTGQGNALSAGSSELGANLGLSNLNASTELGANAQLGTGVGLGLQGATTSAGLAGENYNLGSTAGSAQQQDQNNQLANLYQQWQMQNGYNQNILNQYGQTIQGGYGGTSSGTQTGPSNVAGGLLGLGVLAGTPFGQGSSGTFGGAGSIAGWLGGQFG